MKNVIQLLAGTALVGVMAMALTGCGDSTAPVTARQPNAGATKIKPPAPPSMGAGSVEDGSKPTPKPK